MNMARLKAVQLRFIPPFMDIKLCIFNEIHRQENKMFQILSKKLNATKAAMLPLITYFYDTKSFMK